MNFNAGDRVKVTGDLRATQSQFGKDEEGEMEGMRGKIFKVEAASFEWVTLKGPQSGFTYTFDPSDIGETQPVKVKPQVFEFDERLLDI